MKLSVIVPAYNAERSIEQCLQSICVCEDKDIEIIVVNDGSTDRTQQICKEVAARDRRVKVVESANRGVSSARNIGISIASGKYVMFVDSDDTLMKDAIDQLLISVKNKEYDIIVFGYAIIFENGRKECHSTCFDGYARGYDYLNQTMKNSKSSMRPVWRYAYRSELINSHNLQFDTTLKWAEDYDFNLSYYEYVNSVLDIDVIGYEYRQSSSSVTHSCNSASINSELAMSEKWLSDTSPIISYRYIAQDLAVLYSSAVYLLSWCTKTDIENYNYSIINTKMLLKTHKIRYIVLYIVMNVFGIGGTIRLLRMFNALYH